MSQPIWKFVANLGDADAIENGGRFLYVDETGVYPPEVEVLEEPCEDERASADEQCNGDTANEDHASNEQCDGCGFGDHCAHCPASDALKWRVYRYPLDKVEEGAREWFMPHLGDVASANGVNREDIVACLASDDPEERADAYCMIEGYHGIENFDSYPIELSRAEVEARYTAGEV